MLLPLEGGTSWHQRQLHNDGGGDSEQAERQPQQLGPDVCRLYEEQETGKLSA